MTSNYASGHALKTRLTTRARDRPESGQVLEVAGVQTAAPVRTHSLMLQSGSRARGGCIGASGLRSATILELQEEVM